MTQEEKAKAYDRVSKEVKDFFEGRQKMYNDVSKTLEYLFPELAESEDERTRKELMDFVVANTICKDGRREKYLAWLEKQGDAKREIEKQSKPIEIKRGKNYLCTKTHKYAGEEWKEGTIYDALEDYALLNQECVYYCPAWSKEEHNNCFIEVELNGLKPKFKVDDWITDGEYTWKIIDIRQLDYILQSQDGKVVDDTISYVDEHFHLWTIKDARNGEILVDDIDGRPFIFEGFSDSNYPNSPVAYCGINSECDFRVSYGSYRWTDKDVKPSTKEQRDRLFQKMEKAGYKWDSQNKQILSRIN